jgi:hypothetical protein
VSLMTSTTGQRSGQGRGHHDCVAAYASAHRWEQEHAEDWAKGQEAKGAVGAVNIDWGATLLLNAVLVVILTAVAGAIVLWSKHR